MAIAFQCQGCGKTYQVGDEFAGKLAQCKKCGEKTRIAREPKPDDLDLDLGLELLATQPTAPVSPLARTTYRPAPAPNEPERSKPTKSKFKSKKASKSGPDALRGSGGYQGDHLRHLVWIGIVVAFVVFRVVVKTSMRNDMKAAADQQQQQQQEQAQGQP